jgi:hypothetical protein
MLNTTTLGEILASAIIHTSKNQPTDPIFESIGKAFGHVVLACIRPTEPASVAIPAAPSVPIESDWVRSSSDRTYVVNDIIVEDKYKTGKDAELVIKRNVAFDLGRLDQASVKNSLALKDLLAKGDVIKCTPEEAASLDAQLQEGGEWGNKGIPISGTQVGMEKVFESKVAKPIEFTDDVASLSIEIAKAHNALIDPPCPVPPEPSLKDRIVAVMKLNMDMNAAEALPGGSSQTIRPVATVYEDSTKRVQSVGGPQHDVDVVLLDAAVSEVLGTITGRLSGKKDKKAKTRLKLAKKQVISMGKKTKGSKANAKG